MTTIFPKCEYRDTGDCANWDVQNGKCKLPKEACEGGYMGYCMAYRNINPNNPLQRIGDMIHKALIERDGIDAKKLIFTGEST